MGPTVPLRKDPAQNYWEVNYSLTHPASNWREVWQWCWYSFGHPGKGWDYHGGWLRFYDEKYVSMYALRWA